MTRLRGWCSCGGPLWRVSYGEERTKKGCRLCWITTRRTWGKANLLLLATAHRDWSDRRDEANDTANSRAMSTWLPPEGASDWRMTRAAIGDSDLLRAWLYFAFIRRRVFLMPDRS